MSKPCSQLNSKLIRDKAECNIIARVEKQCSVVGFKCIWRVQNEEIDTAWNWVCEKRDECDLKLSKVKEVCFFFSAISTSKLDTKKRKTPQSSRDSDESNDESSINASQLSSPGKQVFPAVSYWVACQTQNGSAINPLKIQSALGSCGLEFYVSRASRKKGSHDLNTLCQVLKDHKNPCLMGLVQTSYQYCLRALQDELDISDDEDFEFAVLSENVVRLRAVHDSFKAMLATSVGELRRAGLKIDTFGLDGIDSSTTQPSLSSSPQKPLSCPVTVLCNDIQLAMRKLHYTVHRGEVYKQVPKSQFTYSYLCPMKTFLHHLMGNEVFKDRLVQHIQRVLPILSEPECSLMRQLKIDKDLVEVQDGWFWRFSSGSFVQGIIPESQKGVSSPRAFVDYDHRKDPDPKYFKDILRNSLSEEDIKKFCADFVALFRPKQHKQPVPCAIGAADSGKTSLFSPVFQIVPINRIARVTKQKSFNKAMIDSATEVIFLDEAFVGLLDADDWKIICQGGFTSHDAKWKKSKGFHCQASMYITCQMDMDFGAEHNDAMNRRLNKYYFKSLATVVPEANQWLREHAMDCIAWAQKIVGDVDRRSEVTMPTMQDEGLTDEDLQSIIGVSLLEEETQESLQPGPSEENQLQTSQESDTDDCEETGGCFVELRRQVSETNSEGLRGRQLAIMLKTMENINETRTKAMHERRLADRRDYLVNLGVVNPSEAEEQVKDPDGLLPAYLEQKKEEALRARKEERELQKRHEEDEKIKRAFENPWLQNLEKEMAEHSRKMEETDDDEERKLMKSLLEVNSNKLRMFHDGQGTLRLPGAVERRKRFCLDNELVERSCSNLIRNVFSPLPVIVSVTRSQLLKTPSRIGQYESDDDGDDEIFLTPKTPSYVAQYEEQLPCPPSPAMLCTPRKRSLLQSQSTPKRQKKLTSFFQSQQ